jgi:hypothetical protein
MTRPPAGLAAFDSASAMVGALSHCLKGEDFPALGQQPWRQYPASMADFIPRPLRQRLFALMGASEGIPAMKAGTVSTDAIAEWFTRQYPARPYPAIAIGSSNGALVHLYAALGAPWLHKPFWSFSGRTLVIPMTRQRPCRPRNSQRRSFSPANPNVQLHHMLDPSQDRLMARYATYFRPKFLRLPPAYRAFIEERLEPEGTLIVAECGRTWPTTSLSGRHVFQFGAAGRRQVRRIF